MKYVENYYTLRQYRPVAEIASEWANLSAAIQAAHPVVPDLFSRWQLIQIELLLAQAHDLYLQQRHTEAIEQYKKVQALIYQLLYPTSAPGLSEVNVRFPTNSELLRPLVSVSLDLMDMLDTHTIWTETIPSIPIPWQPPEPIERYDHVGIQVAEKLAKTIRVTGELATNYALRGQWNRAIQLQESILRQLDQVDATQRQAVAAATQLNLGTLYTQLGQAKAEQHLNQALAIYTSLQDRLGQAQARHNLGTYYAKQGQLQRSQSYFRQAKTLMNQIQGLPRIATRTGMLNGLQEAWQTLTTWFSPVQTRSASSSDRPTVASLNLAMPSSSRAPLAPLKPSSIQLSMMQAVGNSEAMTLTYRLPGQGAGWVTQPLQTQVELAETQYTKSVGLAVGQQVVQLQWQTGEALPVDSAIEKIYQARVNLKDLIELAWHVLTPSDFAIQLAHLYFYVIPVALGDCHVGLGEYNTAEQYYLSAADYSYINLPIEVPALWQKLAENTLSWGDSLYIRDEFEAAIEIYRKVVEPPGTGAVVWADSPLYRHPKLKQVGDKVAIMLAEYNLSGVGDINPLLAATVLTIRARLLQLNAGLDFYGMSIDHIPIWSFDYLQNVARYFAQQAVQAERQYVSFQDRAENELFTLHQLEQTQAMAEEEQKLAEQQRRAAEAERAVYEGFAILSGTDGQVLNGGIFVASSAQFHVAPASDPLNVKSEDIQPTDTLHLSYPANSQTKQAAFEAVCRIGVDSPTQLHLSPAPPPATNLRWSINRKLATDRRLHGEQNQAAYKQMTDERIGLNQDIAWYSSQNPWELKNPVPGTGQVVTETGLSPFGEPIEVSYEVNQKHIHEIIAEDTQRLQTITAEYELGAMKRQVEEFKGSEQESLLQLQAADARVQAAKQMEVVAQLKQDQAAANVEEFKNQVFTPEVWWRMGNFMWSISQTYLKWAIEVARSMQFAYNFENDVRESTIKKSYSYGVTVQADRQTKTLLAADRLLLDIDSFTYKLVTTRQRKQIPIKQTLSLSDRFPYQFETQLRQAGRMEFDTRLEDFDLAYPGTYAQRLVSVEVEIEGVVPQAGVRGTLTNGGISRYRTPRFDYIKFRLQPKETLVLSEYRVNRDAMIFPVDSRELRIFEGAGVAGTWALDLPRFSNDLDFNSIIDVKLTFNYYAHYDTGLAQAVQKHLTSLTAINHRSRSIPLRWIYPDLFFHFQDTGKLTFTLDQLSFPFNQLDPQIRRLAMLIVTEPEVKPSTGQILLAVPGHPDAIAARPNDDGKIVVTQNHAWQVLQSGSALGDYRIEVQAEEHPASELGGLKPDQIRNLVLLMEYEYAPRL